MRNICKGNNKKVKKLRLVLFFSRNYSVEIKVGEFCQLIFKVNYMQNNKFNL